MKVMCIKVGEWVHSRTGLPAEGNNPKYGEIVIVIEKKMRANIEVYLLEEYLYPGGYAVEHFIPLSDIDETEMIREKELVNV